MNNKTYAELILIQLESLQQTNDITSQLTLVNEILRDAKQLAESTLETEKDAA